MRARPVVAAEISTRGFGRLLLLGAALVALQHLAYAFTLHPEVFQGALVDTDAYLRLVRVAELRHGGDWFSPLLARVSPPEGLVLHWTRPLDVILLAGAASLAPLVGFEAGLHWWGVVLGPVLHLCFLGLMVGVAAPLVGRAWLWLVLVVAVVQPGIAGAFALGRPDHHGLLLLLFAVQLWASLRLLGPGGRGRDADLAAIAGALGIWVGIEFAPAVAVTVAAMVLAWTLGDDRMAGRLARLALVCLVALALALLVERGEGAWRADDLDRLSYRHLMPFALLAGVCLALAGWLRGGARGPRGPGARLALAALALALVVSAMGAIDPGFLAGPMATVDDSYAASHLTESAGRRPVLWLLGDLPRALPDGLARAVAWLGIALAALPWIAWRIVRGPRETRPLWLHLGLGGLLFTALAAAQIRWAGYAEAVLLVAYVALGGRLLAALPERLGTKALVAVRPPLVLAILLWYLLPSLWIGTRPGAEAGAAPGGTVTAYAHCPVTRLAERLADPAGLGARPLEVMAFIDFGPELLYRTPHAVLSVPTHRAQGGLRATLDVMTSRDDAAARRRLADRGVDLLVVCPGTAERAMYARVAGAGGATLHDRLVAGVPPAFLEAVTAADGRAVAAPFRLYRPR